MRWFTCAFLVITVVCTAVTGRSSASAPSVSAGQQSGAVHLDDEPVSIYKRVITSKGGVYVDPDPDTRPRTFLNGEVREEAVTQPQWHPFTPTNAVYGRTVVSGETCPAPDVNGHFATHWDAATPKTRLPSNTFDFSGLGAAGVHYFKTATDPNPAGSAYSVYVWYGEPEVTIDVSGSGTVVWMLDHGLTSEQFVRVLGTTNDCLVLVSRENLVPSGGAADKGFDFRSGLHSPDVPVILVSDAQVKIDNVSGGEYTPVMSYVSIFSAHTYLAGPDPPPGYSSTMTLSHNPNSPFDAPGGLIDRLSDLGALPNSGGAGMSFAPVAGRWREIDPNAPGALDPPNFGL